MKVSALLSYYHIGSPKILQIPAFETEHYEVFFEQQSLTSDLVELATAIYLLHSYHAETFDLQFETENMALWSEVAPDIERLIEFLTHRKMRIDVMETLEKRKFCRQIQFGIRPIGSQNRIVALFSGGADSTAGIINLLSKEKTPIMHHSLTGQIVYGRVKRLHKLMPLANCDMFLTDMREQKGIGGSPLRGFIFLINAYLLCHFLKCDTLVFPENGPLMLNPSMSSFMEPTKNSRPFLISTLQNVFRVIEGKEFKIECIFKDKTKAEVMAYLLNRDLVVKTNSCFQVQGVKNMCGTCFACFVRKFSLLALGYSEPALYSRDPFLLSCNLGDEIMRDLHDSLFFLFKILIDKKDINEYLTEVPTDFFDNPSSLFKNFSADIFLGMKQYFEKNPTAQLNPLGRFAIELLKNVDKRILELRGEQLSILVKNMM